MNKNKTQGIIMVIVGFMMLLTNAFGYILDWDIKNPAFTVLGLIFIIIGLKKVRE